MTMKRTPKLRFQADPAIAAGTRVEELLRGLHHEGGDDDRGVAGVNEGEPPAT